VSRGRATLGANWRDGRTTFEVWAPDVAAMDLVLEPAAHPRFRPDGGGLIPDPGSRFQPHGVHGPSRVEDPGAFPWTDAGWRGGTLADTILYELHIGTFTAAGTFRAAIERLPYFRELGVTAVELMPVADFAGQRNWGYDGVARFAPARCYGAPDDLRALVDARSARGTSRAATAVRGGRASTTTAPTTAPSENSWSRPSLGGRGAAAVWSDAFHHQMRRALAGDADGYFADCSGSTPDIAATARQGWLYRGQHAGYWGAPRGTDATGLALERFIIFLQNHDQIGNRATGDRLLHGIELAAWRAASALLLLLPETPLLFMGQEWGATTPFQFFTDHTADLGRAVAAGRREEFRRFAAFADPARREAIVVVVRRSPPAG